MLNINTLILENNVVLILTGTI